ncbi:non-specific serine/threonine protein kinase [Malassezia nana]|uniref:non-specific serine/threonine protein kinase n=1 Tax=Malassezia nana TaxID=180528 RepID=A0AAF0EKU8_9BASI|nr:non-specific serine/threonine protein kinase [Malassezia nana]
MSGEETAHEKKSVGDYVLDKEIGKGSFAQVYRAHHQHPPYQLVAVKSVTRGKLSPKLLENLEGEISILKSMRHTNIVDLRDCIYTDEYIHLIMEYCPGGDLSQYIRHHGDVAPWDGDAAINPLAAAQRARFPHPEDGGLHDTMVRSFLAQLVSAVRFLRSKDIVHRDIKPQNLLLQIADDECLASGHPSEIPLIKVADFGFARSLPAASLAKTLCGSPLYMAPEILRYEKYDAKADLWSVGAVLYEMCVGKPPFRAANHVELLRRIEQSGDRIKFPDERSPQSLAKDAARRRLHGEPPRPPAHEVAPDIKQLIRRLLKRHPVERMSFDELFTDPVITSVPYSGRAIIKNELAASVHVDQIPLDMLAGPPPAVDIQRESTEPSAPGQVAMYMDIPSLPDQPLPRDAPPPRPAVGFHAPEAAPSMTSSLNATETKPRLAGHPSALSRAISMASDRLFQKSATSSPSPSLGPTLVAPPQATSPIHAQPSTSKDSHDLLEDLRSLAKKAYVLAEFADARFTELTPSTSHDTSYSPAQSSPYSASGDMHEMVAAESLALYVRALGFLQRGLERLHAYAGQLEGEPDPEVRHLAQWFRARFEVNYDKSVHARAQCDPSSLPESTKHIDRQIFDKALELARTAALHELEGHKRDPNGWDATPCILAYETASSLLLGLLDPSEDRMGLSMHSISTVEKFLQSITKRLRVLTPSPPAAVAPVS